MKFDNKLRATVLVCAATFGTSALLVACGGGGGSAAAGTVSSTVSVIDGPIQGALVCLDKDGDGKCGAGETTFPTDATGKATMIIPAADVGKYPIVAMVVAGSIDADTGIAHTAAEAYTLKAPADATGVVSPLTTMVQHAIESDTTKGTTTAAATAKVAAETGITNPMANFVAPATADPLARSVAKAVVKMTQVKTAELATVVSSTDPVNNKVITQADIDAIIRAEIIKLLPAIVTAVQTQTSSGGACATGMSATCQAAITNAVGTSTAGGTAATGLIAQTTVTTTNAAVTVGVTNAGKTPDATSTSTAAATAGVNLDDFRFADANNWSYRTFYASATENNTTDSNGMTANHEGRSKSIAGTVTNWTYHGDSNRDGDLHFDGSAWTTCAASGGRTTKTADSAGLFSFIYCGGMSVGKFSRTTLEIAGKTVISVTDQIKAINSAWGSAPSWASTQVFPAGTGANVFPAGSTLRFQNTAPTASAYAYDSRPAVGTTNNGQVLLYSAAVAAGGDGRTDATHACRSTAFATSPAISAVTLEDMLTYKGVPCTFNQFTVTNPNAGGAAALGGKDFTPTTAPTYSEAWGNSTLSIGTIGTDTLNNATAFNAYTTNTYIRVAFTGTVSDKAVTYYACKQRMDGGSIRECQSIGAGTYSISTQGDARVMTFSGLSPSATTTLGYGYGYPLTSNGQISSAATSALTYDRVFVERGGKVFYGYKNKLINSQAARLNLTATNFVFGLLGIPAIPTP